MLTCQAFTSFYNNLDSTIILSISQYLGVYAACSYVWYRLDSNSGYGRGRAMAYAFLPTFFLWLLKGLILWVACWNLSIPMRKTAHVFQPPAAVQIDQMDIFASSFLSDGVQSPEAFVLRALLEEPSKNTDNDEGDSSDQTVGAIVRAWQGRQADIMDCIERTGNAMNAIYSIQVLLEIPIGRSYGMHQLMYTLALFVARRQQTGCITNFVARDNEKTHWAMQNINSSTRTSWNSDWYVLNHVAPRFSKPIKYYFWTKRCLQRSSSGLFYGREQDNRRHDSRHYFRIFRKDAREKWSVE